MFQRILACLFVLALLAGCGPFGPGESTPTPPPNPTATLAPEASATAAPPAATATTEPPTAKATATTAEAPTAAATATVANAPTAATTGTPQSAQPEDTPDPTTARQLTQIEQNVVELRGLQPKGKVPEHFISSAQMNANLKDQIDADYSPQKGHQDAFELWLMRLMPDRTVDLYQTQIDLLGEQVLGYYDPKQKGLFVRSDQHPLDPLARETLAHEYTHGLQDQYYDLQKMRPQHAHTSDHDSATTSLIEGDATISGLFYAQQYMSKSDFQKLIESSQNSSTAQLDKAPVYIKDSLTFPYDQGVAFVLELYKRGGFAAIDQAFTDPPVSTEQILHPEKYLAAQRDLPLPVVLPPLTDTLGTGWTLQDYDTLGEFDLGELLKVNGAENAQAVAGWGGSRYAFYQHDTAGVVLLGTRWDTTKDATEFETALQKSLSKAKRDADGIWQEGERFTAIKRLGDQIFIVGSTDRALIPPVVSTLK